MTSCWKRAWVAARLPDPPKKLTLRQAVATIVAFAAAVGVFGLITGRWEGVISGGIGPAMGNLMYQWWHGRTAQPEYEEEDNDG